MVRRLTEKETKWVLSLMRCLEKMPNSISLFADGKLCIPISLKKANKNPPIKIYRSKGEKGIKDAAKMLAETPGALHLRTLSTLNDLSSDQSNTVIFALPIEVLKAY